MFLPFAFERDVTLKFRTYHENILDDYYITKSFRKKLRDEQNFDSYDMLFLPRSYFILLLYCIITILKRLNRFKVLIFL